MDYSSTSEETTRIPIGTFYGTREIVLDDGIDFLTVLLSCLLLTDAHKLDVKTTHT